MQPVWFGTGVAQRVRGLAPAGLQRAHGSKPAQCRASFSCQAYDFSACLGAAPVSRSRWPWSLWFSVRMRMRSGDGLQLEVHYGSAFAWGYARFSQATPALFSPGRPCRLMYAANLRSSGHNLCSWAANLRNPGPNLRSPSTNLRTGMLKEALCASPEHICHTRKSPENQGTHWRRPTRCGRVFTTPPAQVHHQTAQVHPRTVQVQDQTAQVRS